MHLSYKRSGNVDLTNLRKGRCRPGCRGYRLGSRSLSRNTRRLIQGKGKHAKVVSGDLQTVAVVFTSDRVIRSVVLLLWCL